MKRMLILTVILLFVSSFSFAEGIGITTKLGFDFQSDQDVSYKGHDIGSPNVKSGVSLSIEYAYLLNEMFELGAGVTYQLPRSLKKPYNGEDFNFIPIYSLAKINYSFNDDISSYLVGQLGYNFFDGNDKYKDDGDGGKVSLKGGIYYGIGVGVVFQKKYQAELLYSMNNGEVSIENIDLDVEYSKIGLSFGYKF